MASVSKSARQANPALTKNGKRRLKPLNLAQAQELFEKTTRARDKGKILNRIKVLEKRAK